MPELVKRHREVSQVLRGWFLAEEPLSDREAAPAGVPGSLEIVERHLQVRERDERDGEVALGSA